ELQPKSSLNARHVLKFSEPVGFWTRKLLPALADEVIEEALISLQCTLSDYGTTRPSGDVRIHGEYWRVSGLLADQRGAFAARHRPRAIGRRRAPSTAIKKIVVEIDPFSERDRVRVA